MNQESAPCLDETEKPMQLDPKITDHEDLSENELDDLTPDSNDETFYFNTLSESDNESASGSESSASVTDPVQTRKFIVFEEELDKLFQFCSECGLPVIEKKKCLKGCMVTVKTVCLEGHTCIWNSQSYANGIPLGNLLLPAAILFSGNTYANLHQFSSIFLNLKFVSESQFTASKTNTFSKWPTILGMNTRKSCLWIFSSKQLLIFVGMAGVTAQATQQNMAPLA